MKQRTFPPALRWLATPLAFSVEQVESQAFLMQKQG